MVFFGFSGFVSSVPWLPLGVISSKNPSLPPTLLRLSLEKYPLDPTPMFGQEIVKKGDKKYSIF